MIVVVDALIFIGRVEGGGTVRVSTIRKSKCTGVSVNGG